MFALTWISIVTCGYVLTVTTAADSTTTASEIRFLLNEEASLRHKLESRITSLRRRADKLNATLTPCICPPLTTRKPPAQVAFTATEPEAVISDLTVYTQFNFSADMVNVGGAYHSRYAHFIAPVSGIYGFSFTAYLLPGYWTSMELLLDSYSIMSIKSGHYSGREHSMGTNFVLVNVTQGGEVWPRYVTGSAVLHGEGVSTFSAFLLHEL